MVGAPVRVITAFNYDENDMKFYAVRQAFRVVNMTGITKDMQQSLERLIVILGKNQFKDGILKEKIIALAKDYIKVMNAKDYSAGDFLLKVHKFAPELANFVSKASKEEREELGWVIKGLVAVPLNNIDTVKLVNEKLSKKTSTEPKIGPKLKI